MTDTDSLVYHIQTDDFYKDIIILKFILQVLKQVLIKRRMGK